MNGNNKTITGISITTAPQSPAQPGTAWPANIPAGAKRLPDGRYELTITLTNPDGGVDILAEGAVSKLRNEMKANSDGIIGKYLQADNTELLTELEDRGFIETISGRELLERMDETKRPATPQQLDITIHWDKDGGWLDRDDIYANVQRMRAAWEGLPAELAASERFWAGLIITKAWALADYHKHDKSSPYRHEAAAMLDPGTRNLKDGNDKTIMYLLGRYYFQWGAKRGVYSAYLPQLWWASESLYDRTPAKSGQTDGWWALNAFLKDGFTGNFMFIAGGASFADDREVLLSFMTAIENARAERMEKGEPGELSRKYYSLAKLCVNRIAKLNDLDTIIEINGREGFAKLITDYYTTKEFKVRAY